MLDYALLLWDKSVINRFMTKVQLIGNLYNSTICNKVYHVHKSIKLRYLEL